MAKPARATVIVQTGLALPFEERTDTKAHLNNEPGITTLSKQRFVIVMPPYTRVPSPAKVQVRSSRYIIFSTPRLHQGCDGPPQSGKHRSPVCGPLAVPCPHEYSKDEDPENTAHNVRQVPFQPQSPAAAKTSTALFPTWAPRSSQHPVFTVFLGLVRPSWLDFSPGPGNPELTPKVNFENPCTPEYLNSRRLYWTLRRLSMQIFGPPTVDNKLGLSRLTMFSMV